MGDTDESLMEKFTCPICLDYMDKKIYICSNGHSICGNCNAKVLKCPSCNVKVNSKRNIAMEKASKKVKEWKAKQDIQPSYFFSSKRKQRLSLGSPISNKVENDHVNYRIQCPYPKCCFSVQSLLQLKIHLQSWHQDSTYAIKKNPSVKSENAMRIRFSWQTNSFHNMYIVSATDAFFVIYIIKALDYVKNSTHYMNVLTVSNETKIYKFSCGAATKFSSFYHGRHQAQEGITIDDSIIEKDYSDGTCRYLIKILITKVADLLGED